MASIARKNLFEDIPRFLVAQAGIMFAVSLVTIQTGIFNGFTRSTTRLIDISQADIWVTSKYMVNYELTLPLSYEQVEQAQKLAGVEQAEALLIRPSMLRDPIGNIALVRVVGFNTQGKLFTPQPVEHGSPQFLNQPYTIMVDESTLDSLNMQWLGDQVEIGAFPARLVGWTTGTQSIVSSSFVYTSLENAYAYANSIPTTTTLAAPPKDLSPEQIQQLAASGQIDPALAEQLSKLSPEQLQELSQNKDIATQLEAEGISEPQPPRQLRPNDQITYVLIKAKPGQNLQALKRNLEATFPNTRALTREEMAERTRTFWVKRTGVGFILGLGAVVGVIVGVVIVGQILYASASDHLKEFGTLKAMGASDWVIYSIIIEQALWMAILGYIPGIVLCWGLGLWTLTQGITILITPTTAIVVLGVTVIMCVSSALFAIQKVTRVDPAVVFKA
jgi:putative ABC transport system permease protein